MAAEHSPFKMGDKMNQYITTSVVCILSALSLTACFDKSAETEVPLAEVPSNIITIVQNTLPGISLNKAEKTVKDNTVIYELEGKLINGNEYEIKITASGTIVKIELED